MTYQLINPDETALIGYDWSAQLDTDVTITGSDFTSYPEGLSFAGESIDGQTTNARVSVVGTGSPAVITKGDYDIYNEITTSDSQTLKEKALTLRVHGQ